MRYNVLDNIFIDEFLYFRENAKNKDNAKYNFLGSPTKFSVEIVAGVKPVKFENNTLLFSSIDGNVLSKENIDNLLKYNFYLCHLDNVSFKDIDIKNDMNQCVFSNCYFRGAKFDNIKLTGSRFYECNFKSSVFDSVVLDYVSFNRCNIWFSQIEECVRSMYTKEKVRLTENLLANATDLNIMSDISYISDISKKYSLKYYREKTFLSGNEHYSKGTFSDKFLFLGKYMLLSLEKIIFGFNLRVRKILLSIFLVTFLFTIIYFIVYSTKDNLEFGRSILLSLSTLVGKSNVVYFENATIYVLNYIHSLCTYVLYGSLLVAIIKKVDR